MILFILLIIYIANKIFSSTLVYYTSVWDRKMKKPSKHYIEYKWIEKHWKNNRFVRLFKPKFLTLYAPSMMFALKFIGYSTVRLRIEALILTKNNLTKNPPTFPFCFRKTILPYVPLNLTPSPLCWISRQIRFNYGNGRWGNRCENVLNPRWNFVWKLTRFAAIGR